MYKTCDHSISPGRGWRHDAVSQLPNLLDFQDDIVAVSQKTQIFEPASEADGSGAEDFAGVQGFIAADMLDHLLEGPCHRAAATLAPQLAIDPGAHREVIRIADLVGRNDTGSENIGEIGRAHV